MGKGKKKQSRKFRKRIFTMIFVIIMLLFVEISYKYIDMMDDNLARAEEISGYVGVELIDSEVYESYKVNKKLFEQKMQPIGESTQNKPEKNANEQVVNEEVDKVEKEETINESEKVEKTANTEEIQKSEKEQETAKEKKIAYLTFDDGPSKIMTPKILDILKEYDIKATFFAVGNSAEKNPDILKRIYEEGHAIGNHTYSHNYKYIYNNPSNFINELEVAEGIFKNILGDEFETSIIRFPGGSFGHQKEAFRNAALSKGYKYIDWNSLNGDAEGHHVPKDKLIERFKSTFSNQQELVILMHDTDAKETTPEALPTIIEFLIENGYEFAAF